MCVATEYEAIFPSPAPLLTTYSLQPFWEVIFLYIGLLKFSPCTLWTISYNWWCFEILKDLWKHYLIKKNQKGVVLISFCSFLGIWTRHVLNYLSSTGCLLDVSYKNNGSWVPVSMSYVYPIFTKASTNLSHYILIFQSSESITGWFYCTCVDKKLKWAKLFCLFIKIPQGWLQRVHWDHF